MIRSLPARLLRAWRAREHTLWPDVALVAALSLATVVLALHAGSAVNDVPAMVRESDHQDVPGGSGVPDAPDIPVPPYFIVATRDENSSGKDIAMNLFITLPLIWRRRWPLACFPLQFFALFALEPNSTVITLAALLIGAYSLTAYARSARVSLSVLLAVATLTASTQSNTWPSQLPGWTGIFALLLPIGLAGVAIRAARSRARASDERATALRRAQKAATRLAVANERARIARELHDVVSHHVSVMTIQAGAAGKVLDAEPELARGALSAIETSGRETMAELRHLLGVLTPEPADDVLHPQPGLDQLDALVDKVRQAGQPVSVRRTPVTLPRGLDLTAYRVVQEALTNALRYAPGARTEVAIESSAAALLIEVTNDAPPPAAAHAGVGGGSGTGLLGLTERLRLYGGTLESGRRAGGGFRVRARLPMEGTTA
ncbi:histidine kinase [Actinomycetes bacterium KLBMP 9797]